MRLNPAAAHRRIARDLLTALQEKSDNGILELFAKAGFAVQDHYIIPHEDAAAQDLILVIKFDDSVLDLVQINQEYRKILNSHPDPELKGIIALRPTSVAYYWQGKLLAEISLVLGSPNAQIRKQSHKKRSFTSRPEKRDNFQSTNLDLLASIVAVISSRPVHDADSLSLVYGEHSILFFYAIDRLGGFFREREDSLLDEAFAAWRVKFDIIYRKGDATEELFLRHAYFALLLNIVLSAAYFPYDTSNEQPVASLVNLLEEQWQQPILERDWFGWALADIELNRVLRRGIITVQTFEPWEITQAFEAGDLFRVIYPQMVAPTTRLALGEFYTPPELARMMAGDAYVFGRVVLDPACGSGTFLSEIYQKILEDPDHSVAERVTACNNIFGFDINPIAVATARVNALVQLRPLIQDQPHVRVCITQRDALFPEDAPEDGMVVPFNECDFVIGNPPWVVLNAVHQADYKERMKALARQRGIGLGAKQMSNLEMSALFFYGAKRFLKDGGRVSFLVSNAFLSGDNHALTRQFLEFDEIYVWKFTRDVFHIHNICISATYRPGLTRTTEDLSQLQVHAAMFDPFLGEDGEISFNKTREDILVPYAVVPKKTTTKNCCPESETGHDNLVKKLVSRADLAKLLPMGPNAYDASCNKGATLIPRNLVFVRVEKEGDMLCDIAAIIQNPKPPWDFDPIRRIQSESGNSTIQVEKSFIFPVLKSDSILPFVALRSDLAFLPVDVDERSNSYALTTRQDSLGWAYFEALNELYVSNQKRGAAVHGLWDNLNYLGKLTPPRQRKAIKVVMMGTGTLIKSCIVQDPRLIIDYSNFFVGLDAVDEAYFLCGFLNAPAVTQTVRVIIDEGAAGSGRNIMKRPFNIRLPRYNSQNELHKEIVNLALKMENHACNILVTWSAGENEKLESKCLGENLDLENRLDKTFLKKLALQNRIYKELGWDTKKGVITGEFAHLDQLIREAISQKGK